MSAELLTDDEIEAALTRLEGWYREGDSLKGEWRFADFTTAFGFMTEIALHAEKRNHHPAWVNVYNRVSVALSTHDSGGITSLDIELAGIISEAVQRADATSTT